MSKLHRDFIADVPECTSFDGNIVVLDTKLRALLPPEVKRMTLRHKQMCGSHDYLSINMYHEPYYRFVKGVLQVLRGFSKGRSIQKKADETHTRL